MARKQEAKKVRKPAASDSRIAEKKPKSPSGMPRSRAGWVVALLNGKLLVS
jgi:hypothetical protein